MIDLLETFVRRNNFKHRTAKGRRFNNSILFLWVIHGKILNSNNLTNIPSSNADDISSLYWLPSAAEEEDKEEEEEEEEIDPL